MGVTPQTITGMTTTETTTAEYTYTAMDADDNTAASDTATLTFRITVGEQAHASSRTMAGPLRARRGDPGGGYDW